MRFGPRSVAARPKPLDKLLPTGPFSLSVGILTLF